jgi:DNA polymerase-3 subunit alpha
MAFVKIEDRYGETEVILFPGSYQQTIGTWERDKVVLIRGKVSTKGRDGSQTDEVKIMVDDAREITAQQAQNYQATGKKKKTPKPTTAKKTAQLDARAEDVADSKSPRLYVRLDSGSNTEMLLSLKAAIDQFQGTTEVVLVLGDNSERQIIKLPSGIDASSTGPSRLAELVGADNVKLQ